MAKKDYKFIVESCFQILNYRRPSITGGSDLGFQITKLCDRLDKAEAEHCKVDHTDIDALVFENNLLSAKVESLEAEIRALKGE